MLTIEDILNRPNLREQLDPGNMLLSVERFLGQCRDAEEIARNYTLPTLKKIEHIVFCGMGGSAIGGDLVRSFASSYAPVPIEVVRNYSLPAYVGKKSLVIACSYSGNTEETLSCYEQAKKRGAQIFAITSGGMLEQLCLADGNPCFRIPSGLAPRAALGYSFFPLVLFFEQWKFLPVLSCDIKAMKKEIRACCNRNAFETPLDANPAKQLACQLHGAIPVIYAGQDIYEPVAARWRAQFNENTKCFAHHAAVPEMNHNEILGWTHPIAWVKKMRPIFLLDPGYHHQTTRRFKIMSQILNTKEHPVIEVHAHGACPLSRLISLVYLGDFVSIYLAYLYKQDPYPIPAIDQLKRELSREHS